MDKMDYWGRINRESKLDLDFERPEQRRLAGSLLIVGGHANSFFSVANVTQLALESGWGEVTTVLPDSLEKKVPKTDGVVFLESENSGGFAKNNGGRIAELIHGVDVNLIVGDMGKNAEAVEFVAEMLTTKGLTMVTRDAVDLAIDTGKLEQFLEDEDACLFLSTSQLKKLLKEIYYPRVLNLTMPLLQMIEVLHKFTLSYSATIITIHSDQIVLAKDGRVLTVALKDTKYNPITVFSGELAMKMLRLYIWNKDRKNRFEAMASVCLEM